MKSNIADNLERWLTGIGMNAWWAAGFKTVILVLLIIFICIAANYIAKEIILTIVRKIVKRSKNQWDDVLLEKKVFHRFSHLVPAIIIYYSAPVVMGVNGDFIKITHSCVFIYIIFTGMFIISAFLNALNEIYLKIPSSKDRPVKGFLQVINIFNFIVGGILILSVVIDKNPGYFLTGIGALAAILLIVFKDSLLGLVAGIQLTANNMVKIGDWISMPSKGTDGTVTEITLHTVKIENWDKTITMLPSYSLVSESFINFRGLEDSKARRVKRSLNIDIQSIRFLDDNDITELKKIALIKEYLENKVAELSEANSGTDSSFLLNQRRLTNIGTFRIYVLNYLKANQDIRQDLTLIVRQLQPNETGLPLELYFFSKIYEWEPFEILQADVFDHLLAVVSRFGLKIFQSPSGDDFRNLT